MRLRTTIFSIENPRSPHHFSDPLALQEHKCRTSSKAMVPHCLPVLIVVHGTLVHQVPFQFRLLPEVLVGGYHGFVRSLFLLAERPPLFTDKLLGIGYNMLSREVLSVIMKHTYHVSDLDWHLRCCCAAHFRTQRNYERTCCGLRHVSRMVNLMEQQGMTHLFSCVVRHRSCSEPR